MRKQVILVFDDFINGTTSVYTPSQLNDVLGRSDQIAAHAVSDQASGTSPTITVRIQASGDNRNFDDKAGSALIATSNLTANATNSHHGADGGSTQNDAYVRLAITLGGTSPSAHVKLYVCLRDQSTDSLTSRPPSRGGNRWPTRFIAPCVTPGIPRRSTVERSPISAC